MMIGLDIDYTSVWNRICAYRPLPDAKAHVSSALQKQIMYSLPQLAYRPSDTAKHKKRIGDKFMKSDTSIGNIC